MRRTQLYLDEWQRKALERLSRKTGKSVGQLVREAVDEVYCSKKTLEQPIPASDPIWKFIGGSATREKDIASRHDHYLYGIEDEDIR